MSARRMLVISILALFCFSPMQGPLSSHLQADDGVLEAGPASLEILMMGNSYTSANSLDSIVDGVLSAASNSANVTSLTGGGMRLSQHSSNVASSGHQWNTTLNNGVWNPAPFFRTKVRLLVSLAIIKNGLIAKMEQCNLHKLSMTKEQILS